MSQSVRKPSGAARFLGIVAIYAIPGPLIGAFGVNVLFTAYALGIEVPSGDTAALARLFWGGLVVGTMIASIIAYAFGVVSALGVGLAVAIGDRRRGAISGETALMAALVLWLLTALAVLLMVPAETQLVWAGMLLVGHLLAATLCTWIARRLFARRGR